MGFWLFDIKSIKDAALFPTGGLGNFLNTLTIAIITAMVVIKNKFNNIIDDITMYKYGILSLCMVTLMGLVLCRGERSSNSEQEFEFDLSYD